MLVLGWGSLRASHFLLFTIYLLFISYCYFYDQSVTALSFPHIHQIALLKLLCLQILKYNYYATQNSVLKLQILKKNLINNNFYFNWFYMFIVFNYKTNISVVIFKTVSYLSLIILLLYTFKYILTKFYWMALSHLKKSYFCLILTHFNWNLRVCSF
jgi:hypothetical protein